MTKRFNILFSPKRIEFWIVIFFLLRLFFVANPPLEIGHNWRQVTGLMVSRNFLEVDANILYPRVDDHAGKTGIIGMEFPFMNYLYFLLAKLFGYTHWYGRLINLIAASFGILFFHKLVVKFFSEKTAFFSSLALLGSIWFSFSLKMMPDIFSISLMLVALFYAATYFEEKCGH